MAEQTTRRGLWEPILDGGIRNTHFFNGRLLTALDLKTDQDANRQQHQQLGQAIGEGVVRGFEVSLVADGSSGGPPILSVSSGLALNRAGQAIALPTDLPEVMLARQLQTPALEAGLFAACVPPKDGGTPTGTGVYILVISPASGFRERVPMRGLGEKANVDGCGSRYAVEGVKFRLEELHVSGLANVPQTTRNTVAELMTKTDPASLSRLRNLLAHVCFGTEERSGFARDPLRRVGGPSPYTSYGAVDALRATGKLTDCDVPVALLYWTVSSVKFVDMWSVRRKPTPRLRSAVWPLPVSERALSEAEAVFLQFQDQMDHLLGSSLSQSALAAIHAADYFRYLPSGGFLALRQGSFRGIELASFFNQQPHRDLEFIDGAVIRALLHEAMTYEPVDLSAGELVWLYQAWQHAKAIDDGGGMQPYVIFASGHMPPRAKARFDVARWDYSHYA
jgi:hypothetical protein